MVLKGSGKITYVPNGFLGHQVCHLRTRVTVIVDWFSSDRNDSFSFFFGRNEARRAFLPDAFACKANESRARLSQCGVLSESEEMGTQGNSH